MTGTISAAISDEPVLLSNSFGSVTPNFLISRNTRTHAFTIIPISHIVSIEMVKKPYPHLLVIAGGLFVVAGASFSSKEGDGAGFPFAILGCFFVLMYFSSRRAIVTLVLDSGSKEIITGSIKEAVALIELLESPTRRMRTA